LLEFVVRQVPELNYFLESVHLTGMLRWMIPSARWSCQLSS